jgi:hypothetical protein
MHNVEVEILFISMNYRFQRPEDLDFFFNSLLSLYWVLKHVQRAVTILSEIRTDYFLSTSLPDRVDIHQLASFSHGHWTARNSKFSSCCVYRISSLTYYL